MDMYRLRHTIGMCLTRSAVKRAEYLKKHDILYHIGDHCMTMFRTIPLYPKLISMGDNVWIASNVHFVPHDVIHEMVNHKLGNKEFQEQLGCIRIGNNVFIGSGTRILLNVSIGDNTVIAAGSLVNKSLPGNGVYGGVPAKYLGSLDDLIEKRRNEPVIDVKKIKGNITEETVEACWKRFHELHGEEE